jgi:cysteine synthase A
MDQARIELYSRLQASAGGTSLHLIEHLRVPNGNRIWAKMENENPTESAFDRVYPGLFKLAETSGTILPHVTPVIECSTGNAGASFAWAAKELGFESRVIIHEDSPPARIAQIRQLGAEVVFSPPNQYGAGYVEVLNRLLEEDRRVMAERGGDPLERLFAITKIVPEARGFHSAIAQEAVEELGRATGRRSFAAFVAAVGSGDLVCGVAQGFRDLGLRPRVVGMEAAEMPTASTLMNGDVLTTAPLPVEDLMLGVTGTSLPMGRLNIDFGLIDEIIGVTIDEWKATDALLVEQEGLEVGRTSAGSLAAALKLSETMSDADILTIFFDSRWKYGTEFLPKNPELYCRPSSAWPV